MCFNIKMKVTLEIPEEEAKALSSKIGNLSQAAMEALVAHHYETGVLSSEQVRRIMGFESRWEV